MVQEQIGRGQIQARYNPPLPDPRCPCIDAQSGECGVCINSPNRYTCHVCPRLMFYRKGCGVVGGSFCGTGGTRGGTSSGSTGGDSGGRIIGSRSGGSGGMSDGALGVCAFSFAQAMTMRFSSGWDG